MVFLPCLYYIKVISDHLFQILCFESFHFPASHLREFQGLEGLTGQDPLSNCQLWWLDFHIEEKTLLWFLREVSQGTDDNFLKKSREVG